MGIFSYSYDLKLGKRIIIKINYAIGIRVESLRFQEFKFINYLAAILHSKAAESKV